MKSNYERDAAPDPYTYHYSSAPHVDASTVLGRFQINMHKIPPKNQEERPFVIAQETSEANQRHRCDLCNMQFSTDDDLSSHIASNH